MQSIRHVGETMSRSITVVALILHVAAGFAQNNCPLKQEEVLKIACGRQTLKEKVDTITLRGVAFEIDLAFAKNVNAQCGQQVELIRAIEKNYRTGCAKPSEPEPPKQEESLPGGPPLTRHQVILLLDAKVDQEKVIRLIEKRKAAFEVAGDAATTNELKAAGADAKLLGALVIHGAK
jgi:hypothetical protein